LGVLRAVLDFDRKQMHSARKGIEMKLSIFHIGILCLVHTGTVSTAIAADWPDYIEFRDTVKSGTVPEPLVAQGKIVIQA
jgi:hypothetical protein